MEKFLNPTTIKPQVKYYTYSELYQMIRDEWHFDNVNQLEFSAKSYAYLISMHGYVKKRIRNKERNGEFYIHKTQLNFI